ncbi:MAG TPA: 7-cyano-7-deazaguanine synthase QueC [Candidatus Desulfofervidus auxilii]|uniref:7-cyano-7-deazaguanine synthase n=1 Tax=Desulfofervidus auxilii TaxID=1621989 RepID=A0A7V0IAQ6_DESA2|nr:7-cyano-7-deazaguanine synthase QueC [Candidatus Desulfofervidus auxilii]
MKKAIVLVSGGIDSCVTAAIAAQRYELAFLHVNYGQRTEKRELKAFEDIANHYKVKHRLIVSLSFLKKIGGSSLTDESIPIPENKLEEEEKRKEVPSTYVPFRNTHLIAIAVSWAEVIKAEKIFVGAMEENSSGYPDCREEYFRAYNKLIELGTRPETHIEIVTPIIHMKKAEVVKRGVELNAPLHLTWSCYQNEVIACGKCSSCLLRLRAFAEAGVKDPIPYVSSK